MNGSLESDAVSRLGMLQLLRDGRGVPAVTRSSPAVKTAVDDEIDTGARARGVGSEKGGRPGPGGDV
jgi:hypothetical protein